MVKNGKKTEAGEKKAVKRILITQPRPESIKSPYFELAAKHSSRNGIHAFYSAGGHSIQRFQETKN